MLPVSCFQFGRGELILPLGCGRGCARCRSKCLAPKEMQQSEQVSGRGILLCWLPDKTVRPPLGKASRTDFSAPLRLSAVIPLSSVRSFYGDAETSHAFFTRAPLAAASSMSATACIFRSDSISPPRPSERSPMLFFERQESKCSAIAFWLRASSRSSSLMCFFSSAFSRLRSSCLSVTMPSSSCS